MPCRDLGPRRRVVAPARRALASARVAPVRASSRRNAPRRTSTLGSGSSPHHQPSTAPHRGSARPFELVLRCRSEGATDSAAREARCYAHCVVLLLLNAIKHVDADPIPDPGTDVDDGIDPCSSAGWFGGWKRPPPRAPHPPCAPARTWLLRVGWWKRHGLLGRDEAPSAG